MSKELLRRCIVLAIMMGLANACMGAVSLLSLLVPGRPDWFFVVSALVCIVCVPVLAYCGCGLLSDLLTLLKDGKDEPSK